jgi:UDP-glucuronate 4-epimerase
MTAPAPKTYLVTGAAGFIGYAVSRDLLARGDRVVGFDNLNDYYDPALKQARLDLLAPSPAFTFVRGDLADRAAVDSLFSRGPFDAVIHLAAQAGVRYSVTHPEVYGQSNLVGFLHVLEACRAARVPHLVYASSSSVYGLDAALPFCVHGPSAHPVSLYAATKRANELMAHAYSHLFAIPATGLRFFTVYGPWGRPDMALFKFTRAILADQPVDLYNHGRMKRDFTYVDDISRGVLLAADRPPAPDPAFDRLRPDPARSTAPWRLYNIGNHTPVELERFVTILEDALGRKAVKNYLPMQPGDVESTCADVSDLSRDTGFAPSTPLETGIPRFVAWYRDYYRV